MERRVYLDYSATTPLHEDVAREMERAYWSGNPLSLHWAGREARDMLDGARERIAKILGCMPYEIVFTSGGTESINTAIKGVVFPHLVKGRKVHVVSTKVEHSATLKPLEALGKLGVEVTLVDVGSDGIPDPDDIRRSIRKDTVLVSVMWANNEVGTIFPIEQIARVCKEMDVFLHVDAVQVVGKIPIDLSRIPIDLLSISAHKFYGPKGAGLLFVRKGVGIEPLLHGGKYEDGLRGGTPNVAGAVGLAKALELVTSIAETENARLRKLQKIFEEGVKSIPGTHVVAENSPRLPSVSNVIFEGVEGETLVIALDMRGIAVSTGAACKSGSREPSHVLRAMGYSPEMARQAVRFSFGLWTEEEDINYTLAVLEDVLSKLRKN